MKPTAPKYCISKVIRSLAFSGLMLLLLPVMALAAPPSPLNPASPAARSIANLHNIVLVIATIVFLIVLGLLIYSLIRFRRRSADDPEPDQSFHGNATLETIWTIIPVGILVVLLVLTFQSLRDIDPNRPTDLTIKVIGRQWLWAVEYPEQDIQLTGQMYVPVNTDVRIEITSEDVLHSFWVPQLGGKKDAVPGYLQVTWFRANMPIEVKVVEQEDFDLWINSQSSQETQVAPPETEPQGESEAQAVSE
jgi:cytochrome c oxidase subunit II